jgi:hypothetical protein
MTLHHRGLAPWRVVAGALTWHVTSQQHARRNALAASTDLLQRRRERDEVEEFLAARAGPLPGRPKGARRPA